MLRFQVDRFALGIRARNPCLRALMSVLMISPRDASDPLYDARSCITDDDATIIISRLAITYSASLAILRLTCVDHDEVTITILLLSRARDSLCVDHVYATLPRSRDSLS